MVGYAGSPTYTAYVDMTLTRSKLGHRQGHGVFELPTTSEAVHAGGDDRSPLAGLSGCVVFFQRAACSTFQTCILNSH